MRLRSDYLMMWVGVWESGGSRSGRGGQGGGQGGGEEVDVGGGVERQNRQE